MSTKYRIATIPGDGIGKEVIPAGQRAVEAVAKRHGFTVEWDLFEWSCERFAETGRMMPKDGVAQVRDHDALYLGAVGFPGVPDHVSLWGLLIPLRRELDQYANVRPVRLLRGVHSPLAGRTADDIDFVVVRENVEGEYSEVGGRVYTGTDREMVVQEAVFTRHGVDRAASRYPTVETAQFHIDILTAHFVLHPDWFDVVVASNLFGDILSDLGPAVAGSIGIAPAANINPERTFPSMFEPVHGSAPDIAGHGIANPIGAIWSAAMMLDHLGQGEAARELEVAIEASLEHEQTRTRDLGGSADTSDALEAVLGALV